MFIEFSLKAIFSENLSCEENQGFKRSGPLFSGAALVYSSGFLRKRFLEFTQNPLQAPRFPMKYRPNF